MHTQGVVAMWNKKSMATVALILIVVFGVTVVVYPLLFNPNKPAPTSPVDQPVANPVN
ncbi:hypothetical protein B9G69_002340 [Bdellovibrio sp. SKB1291214]|uniref:hypothetical protein n=1 Tax=Bdellovibrio sp. SKB1291214 TaxID=1732569 RepID=UPI0015952C1D|nr:hypothetical protein [Bdellovibrio sp. SKB1291214]UYL09411.1 hypothetical protein B9G69_002340 [Bdellovibrio sp. SKB1291214]